MNFYETIARIQGKIMDREDEMEHWIAETKISEHPLAIQMRQEYQEELDKIRADKERFLELTAADPIQAIKDYHDYLFPEQLKVKHEIESL